MHRSVLIGWAVAGLAICAGLWLDGGTPAQILQPTAALIVLGGTLGAVLVHFPGPLVREALAGVRQAVGSASLPPGAVARQLLAYAAKARRGGLLVLDPELAQIEDPFRRKCLMLAIDGMSPQSIRSTMELELERLDERSEEPARVWEAAAGYSPTMGILGAVLGLIQVMQRLGNIESVGKGIAVAFVATLYGVGSANLIFLPIAGHLRAGARTRRLEREMTIDAVCLMAEGANPRVLRERLDAHVGHSVAGPVAKLVAR